MWLAQPLAQPMEALSRYAITRLKANARSQPGVIFQVLIAELNGVRYRCCEINCDVYDSKGASDFLRYLHSPGDL
jgi:hypothetical protein